MQEDVHQPSLTVLESMITAANLKLGNSVTHEQKMCQVSSYFRCTVNWDIQLFSFSNYTPLELS